MCLFLYLAKDKVERKILFKVMNDFLSNTDWDKVFVWFEAALTTKKPKDSQKKTKYAFFVVDKTLGTLSLTGTRKQALFR